VTLERAELLNNYFCSVCTHDDGISPGFVYDKRVADTCIDCVTFSCANIQRAIKKLEANLASGIDGFPPLLVKKLVPSLLQPLSLLYELFLSVGKIPDEWWGKVVMPIYKSGPPDDLYNYRPIALTSIYTKIM